MKKETHTLAQTNGMYLTNNSIYILMKVSKLVRWFSNLTNLSCRLAI